MVGDVVILVREWGITVLRFAMLRYGVMAAGRGGKIKTVLQAVAIILYLLPLATVAPWAHVVAMIVMGAGALDHGAHRARLRPRGRPAPRGRRQIRR